MRGSGEASFLSVIQSKVQKAQHNLNTHNDTQLRIVAHPPNTVTIDQLIMMNLPTVHLPVLWWNLIVLISLYLEALGQHKPNHAPLLATLPLPLVR